MTRHRQLSEEEVVEMRRLWELGVGAVRIGAKFGVVPAAVRYWRDKQCWCDHPDYPLLFQHSAALTARLTVLTAALRDIRDMKFSPESMTGPVVTLQSRARAALEGQ